MGSEQDKVLSAAEIDNMRERAQAFSDGENEEQIGDVAADRQRLLAHLDALHAPPEDGGEALGRMLWRMILPYLPSARGSIALDTAVTSAALALYTRGRAAGRAEGEAERAQLQAIIDGEREGYQELLARRAAEIACLATALDAERAHHLTMIGRLLAEAQRELDATRAELAEAGERETRAINDGCDVRERDRLCAELAEVRATGERWKVACERQEQANASADREDDKRLASARIEGAREGYDEAREQAARVAEEMLIEYREIDVLDTTPEKVRIARRIRRMNRGDTTARQPISGLIIEAEAPSVRGAGGAS